MNYQEFIEKKTQLSGDFGFEPIELPKCLFDFQAALVDWAIRKGRAAIFADCGLGKSLMQLVWADNVVRKTNQRVLILTPIAVGIQTVAEAEKFGIPTVVRSRDGTFANDARIIITNYEQLHRFKAEDFNEGGVVCDESSILKNFDGARKSEITDFMRKCKYRLLCTATAAPNDHIELGTSSEALGELGYMDMITRFFKKLDNNAHLNPQRRWEEKHGYRFRGHAEHDFWRWVCSWGRAVRKPSDLGFDDAKFTLPPIEYNECLVKPDAPRPGLLFEMPAIGLKEQRDERRRTIKERCEMAADRANHSKQVISWCHLNDEGNLLEELVKDCEQISGNDTDETKEDKLAAFVKGEVRALVSKPILAGFGLNFQNCAHQTFFPSHSFEQFYQGVRRCWRFGQTKKVVIDVITSEAESGVTANLNRKSAQADKMFQKLVLLMNDHLKINVDTRFNQPMEAVTWLK